MSLSDAVFKLRWEQVWSTVAAQPTGCSRECFCGRPPLQVARYNPRGWLQRGTLCGHVLAIKFSFLAREVRRTCCLRLVCPPDKQPNIALCSWVVGTGVAGRLYTPDLVLHCVSPSARCSAPQLWRWSSWVCSMYSCSNWRALTSTCLPGVCDLLHLDALCCCMHD